MGVTRLVVPVLTITITTTTISNNRAIVLILASLKLPDQNPPLGGPCARRALVPAARTRETAAASFHDSAQSDPPRPSPFLPGAIDDTGGLYSPSY
jgi:hypothetical protein